MVRVEYNKDMTRLNTFRMRVSAACYVEYGSLSDLEELFGKGGQQGMAWKFPRPFLYIGEGSNLLFTGDFPGTVFHSAIRFIGDGINDPDTDTVTVESASGVKWDDFCAWSASKNLWGPENLSAIPGEVGAAAVQNIGAYGVEIKDIIVKVKCFDTVTGTEKSFSAAECRYGYRDSLFKDTAKGRYIVTSVIFRLSSSPNPCLDYGHVRYAVEKRMEDTSLPLTPGLVRSVVEEIRSSKLPDPSEIGSAGSFFKNPVVPRSSFSIVENYARSKYGADYTVPHYDTGSGFVKIPAAWLIEHCGWKGYRDGNVGVYEKQPLVIVNLTGAASPEEITALEEKITGSVRDTFGIELYPEVEHLISTDRKNDIRL